MSFWTWLSVTLVGISALSLAYAVTSLRRRVEKIERHLGIEGEE